jgi:hypothetical protein
MTIKQLAQPLGENFFGPDEDLEDEVEVGPQRYLRDVAAMETFIEHAPLGTLVLEYNGLGGRIPHSYGKVASDRELPNVLRMGKKTDGGFTLPFDDAE